MKGSTGYCIRKSLHPPPQAGATPEGGQGTAPTPHQSEEVKWDTSTKRFAWEEEKERLMAVGRQAGDTVRCSPKPLDYMYPSCVCLCSRWQKCRK